ncbi:zinc ribbon domain-containing protein [Massilia sp. Se16.2.3]|uniref:zinc ribbon domain-containing protein n=1 Tax=Massilia sp. Se16.2.3 TaxID=2709303 RepID=UPI0016027B39|nr:zinc ribbon domain-containing protein [Massilia sp. Se16.2.3]QNA99223.1 serine endopeptidase [Massilia sp. Se16.2.3]
MSKGLRLTEKWLNRALWLVALAFAGFLIGLGGKLVENLADVEEAPTVEQFMDPARLAALRAEQKEAEEKQGAARERRDQAVQKHEVARSNTQSARATFDNWLATRKVTARPEQDPELISRTHALDALEAEERKALAAVEAQDQALLDAGQQAERTRARWNALEQPALIAHSEAVRALELRVFGYRLALTLPLLLAAGWLFKHKRKGPSWPFAWGFIFFALFAFFFELVPYLPSYGGYVRYVVGIVVTVVAGRYAIASLQRYLARQKESEALPDVERRQTLRYDVALARLGKGVCPGCERAVDLKDGATDFCPHCGIGLFNRCGGCTTRKNAFGRFCFSCGTAANTSLAD